MAVRINIYLYLGLSIMALVNETRAWAQLHQHQRTTVYLHMRDLFQQDKNRFSKMHEKLNNFIFDYSKNRITEETLELLIHLAQEVDLSGWIEKLRTGEAINSSENRPVLHTALRQDPNRPLYIHGKNIMAEIKSELERAFCFAETLRAGNYLGYSGKVINRVVNIGIGGSDLGPKMVYYALKAYQQDSIPVHYIANVDAADLKGVLTRSDPEKTLFIVASKSFTTPETLLNASLAKKWMIEKGASEKDLGRHFFAVTSKKEQARAFGIEEQHIFSIFEGVGGRYSVWSAISLSVMVAIGKKHFQDFLLGARAMDDHFFSAPFRHNIPVLMGLIGVWYNTFYRSSSHAIIPYSHALRFFPAHIQQVDMESNGKRVNREGDYLVFDTGAVIWGEEGVNAQHAFFQLLHQGTRLIPSDFIAFSRPFHPEDAPAQKILVANALAQTSALMKGKTREEVLSDLSELSPVEQSILSTQKTFPGNQPTNTLLFDQLNPFNLGMLLALYEHKVFVEGIIWGLNSFDQWGVEYGKVLARTIEPMLSNPSIKPDFDASTNALINIVREQQR